MQSIIIVQMAGVTSMKNYIKRGFQQLHQRLTSCHKEIITDIITEGKKIF